jgi:hypothetical protein
MYTKSWWWAKAADRHTLSRETPRLNQQQRDLIEMLVQGEKVQPVLDGRCRNPDIVARNRAAFLPQIEVDLGIPQRRLLSYVEDTSRWLTEKSCELFGVFGIAGSR